MGSKASILRGLEVVASQAFYSSTPDGSSALLSLARFLHEIEDGTLKEDQAKDLLEDPERVAAYIKDTPPLSSVPDAKAMSQALMRVQRAIVSVHLHLHGMDLDLERTHQDFEQAHADLEKMLKALNATQTKVDKLDKTLGTIAKHIEEEVIAGVHKLNQNTKIKTAVLVSLIVGSVGCLATDFLYERFHSVVEPFLPPKTVTQSFHDCKQATTLPDGSVLYICPPDTAGKKPATTAAKKPDTAEAKQADTTEIQPPPRQIRGRRFAAPSGQIATPSGKTPAP